MSFQKKLEEWKDKNQAGIAIQEMSGTCKNYGELYADVMEYAGYFYHNRRQGGPNRIALLGATSYQWLCHAYGALTAGLTVIAVDPLLPTADILSLLQYADAEGVYMDEEDGKLQKAIEDKGMSCCLFLSPEKLHCSASQEELVYEEDGDIIFFTSGTSGKAKGVVLPFEAVYENAGRLAKVAATGIEGKMYTPLPFYHIYATTMTLVFLWKGQTVCLGNPRNVFEEIAYFQPSIFVVVSAMAEYLLQKQAAGDKARLFAVAGAKCDKTLETKVEAYGMLIQNLYGASETAGAIGVSRIGQGVDRMLPVDGVTVTVEADGEIVICAAGHMKQYYKNQQATAETLRGDRIYLGDVGAVNEDKTFTPLGRKQDVIAMKNGNKLYCDEMDEEITSLEGVEEACVIYVEGKVIAAVVPYQKQEPDMVRKIIKRYNKNQPYFRKIDEIWIRNSSLPRTGINKLKRNEVGREYLEYKKTDTKETE